MGKTALFVRKQSGGMFTVVNEGMTTGNIWFVNSATGTDAAGYGQNPDAPTATIDYAVGLCTANNGDRIYVMPGHTETVIAAGGLDLDVAGITIIGIGDGAVRPTVNFTTATSADADVDAANVTLVNLLFTCGIDEQSIMLDVNADDCTIQGCEFRGSSTAQPLAMIDNNGGAANAADRMTVRGCKFISYTAATAANEAIELGEVNDEILIKDCVIDGDWGNAGIHNPTGKVLTNLRIMDCAIRNRQTGDHAIELVSACTGEAVGNKLFGDTLGTIFDPGSLFCADNYESAAIDVPAVPSPVAVQDGSTNLLGADNSNNAAATTNVAANEDGSALERLEQLQEAVNKGTGTALAANKSILDAIGFDGSAVIAASAGMLRVMAGTAFVVKKTLTSSAIVAAGVDVTAVSTVGDLQIFDVNLLTDGTGLAAGTNFTLETNNAKGAAVFMSTAVSGLGATALIDLDSASVTSKTTILESGKKVIAKCTVADCTGAGTIDVYLMCRRLADGAALTAAA